MEDHVYRLSEVVGTSSEGIDQAIRNAVARANRTLRNLDWFQVSEIRGVCGKSGGSPAEAWRSWLVDGSLLAPFLVAVIVLLLTAAQARPRRRGAGSAAPCRPPTSRVATVSYTSQDVILPSLVQRDRRPAALWHFQAVDVDPSGMQSKASPVEASSGKTVPTSCSCCLRLSFTKPQQLR